MRATAADRKGRVMLVRSYYCFATTLLLLLLLFLKDCRRRSHPS